MSKDAVRKLGKLGRVSDVAASRSGPTRSVPLRTNVKEHGREIYVFAHLQTKQVIYSLEKSMNKNDALGQLPYNGKKTVPATLRKDLWQPFAKIEFEATTGAASAGLVAFRKLREYRRLHELSWPDSVAVDKDGKTLSRKARGRVLCDQRANSVADMAAALESVTGKIDGRFSTLGETMSPEERKQKRRVRQWAARHAVAKEGEEPAEKETPTVRALVKWADIYDAEYAEKWPKHVVHDTWETTWNNRRVSLWNRKVDGELLEPVRADWRLQSEAAE